MKTRTVMTSVLAAGIAFTAFAADKVIKVIPEKVRKARIDVSDPTNKNVLKPGKSMRVSGWLKDRKNYNLFSSSRPLTTDKWVDYVVDFTPQQDGEVVVKLCGLWWRAKGNKSSTPIYVLYDDVEITGAELKNPGFEELDAKGKPAHWWTRGKIVKDARTGKNAIKVSIGTNASQRIKVKKGQKVTIKAKVKYPK